MKILVNGINGFVGRHAAALFSSRGHSVCGADLHPSSPLPFPYRTLDVTRPAEIDAVLSDFQPDAVLHLSGIAFVPDAWRDPRLTFEVNAISPLSLLASVSRLAPSTRVLFVSSAEVYGPAPDAPVSESSPLRPANLYAASKAAADTSARIFADHLGLDLVIARPANHIGPGQSPAFVSSAFASRLRAIANGAPPVLSVGNLDSTRDFLDVRDVVLAYALLLEKPAPGGTFTIASGRPVPIRSILDSLCAIAGVSPEIRTDPAFFRPTSLAPRFDTSLLRSTIPWSPSIPLQTTLSDLYASLPSPSTPA